MKEGIYEIFDKTGKDESRWSWRLLLEDKVVGESQNVFTKGEVQTDIKKIRSEVSKAYVIHPDNKAADTIEGLRFDYFKIENDWHWHLTRGNEYVAKGVVPDDIFQGRGDVNDTVEDWVKQLREAMSKAKTEWEDKECDPAYQDKKDDCTETKGIPGSRNIEEIREYLKPILNDAFCWSIDIVRNQNDPILFIWDYSPSNDSKDIASFAMCLSQYRQKTFPNKCWITKDRIKEINGSMPNPHGAYKEFSYKDKVFYPYSVDLSGFEIMGLKEIIDRLYAHIDWG